MDNGESNAVFRTRALPMPQGSEMIAAVQAADGSIKQIG